MSVIKSEKHLLNRQILNLSIPNIVTNITVPLVGLVDIALMGHLDNYIYIGAIALGSMIFNMIYTGVLFLRMGTSGFTAQAFGAKNKQETANILFRSFILAQIIAIMLLLLQTPIEWLGFTFVNGEPQVEAIAQQYFKIRIWAAPATLGVYALSGWFLGMQNARIPMFIALIINTINIICSLYFVKITGLKSNGVALGTVIAQYSGLISAILFYLFKYKNQLPKVHFKNIVDWHALKIFFKVNNDILIRSILLMGTFFYFNAISAALGSDILAINAVLLQFFMIFSYFVDGFAFAAEALVGKYLGAANQQLLKSTIKRLLFWGLGLGVVFSLVYWVGNKTIISMLTDNQSLIDDIVPYSIWIIIVPIISFSAFLWDGIYTGATASAAMRNNMIIAAILVFIPARFIFVPLLGNHGLWLSLILFVFARGAGLWIYYPHAILKKLKQNE
jgi:MATE family multidrug resistance protein